MNLPALPEHQNTATGNPFLDRIQNNVRALTAFVRALAIEVTGEVSIITEREFTTQSTEKVPTLLAFDGKAGEDWHVQIWTFAGNSNAAGMKYALGMPEGSTIDAILDSSLTNALDDAHVPITSPNALTSAVHTVAGGTRDDYISARVTFAKDGRFVLMVASTNASTTTTIRSFACLRAKRVRRVR